MSTLPPQNIHLFQVRSAGYQRTGSPLNPLNTSTEATRKHLMNLERLLQKQPDPTPPDPGRKESAGGKGFWEGLNLTRVWLEMKATEEMSPRHLNRLQRLLSKSAEYSPRNSLACRWREYHGSNDWAGLLDPLDENLRREVVRFGEFIQAAYHCFHTDPATPAGEAPWPRHVALPDRSYRVTRSLYATSSVGLPRWVDDVAPELGWMTQRSSWIGYVAVCDNRAEIKRMGRRDIVIALRGTATCLEWAENLRDLLVPISDDQQEQPKAQCGFLSLFRTRAAHVPSLAESIVEEIRRLVEKYKGEDLSITITGHSLGAALSLLVADELSTGCSPAMPPIAVFSFGGPRVGNRAFADRLNSNGVKVLRIVNSQDVITRVPGMLVSEDLERKLRSNGAGRLMDVVDSSMPWAYAHVGTELKLDTKMSPFLKPDADIACCHDLEAYLHLVDGYHASGCPFRANAKRSLWRLLNEQRSNIKRLYTNKVNTLTTLNVSNTSRNNNIDLSLVSCLPSPS